MFFLESLLVEVKRGESSKVLFFEVFFYVLVSCCWFDSIKIKSVLVFCYLKILYVEKVF